MEQKEIYMRAQALLQGISNTQATFAVKELLFLTSRCKNVGGVLMTVAAFNEDDLRILELIVRRINSISKVVRMLPRS